MEKAQKKENYQLMIAQAKALFDDERNALANLSNASALLKQSLPDSVFAGFYLYDGYELVLGPFQGQVSCVRIALGKGVCGEVAQSHQAMIVDDVMKHANYIACDSAARSEIVIPMIKENRLIGVLDLDSGKTADYDTVDLEFLQNFLSILLAKTDWNFSMFEVRT
ncbi:GAF domain-containing protein [Streptococcus sciuri]|uniref:GAF domain-containing protein n=1 Tax=Streptococcus sciuri TaxID=2973939 RepID=A0ABT2F4V1_9STRE|nr:GAF domain-containing protein [Streptococcus sciuri]MCS4487432.1 GAF domain-containing protein [Streptococcus sciuri]